MGYKKAGRGRSNNAVGDAFERVILAESAPLVDRRQAEVFKVPSPGERVGVPKKVHAMVQRIHSGNFVARQAKRVWVDFAGTIWGPGRAVHFEAKSTDSATSCSWTMLEDHQRATLERQARAGAVVFLYVQRRGLPFRQPRYLFPVDPGAVESRDGKTFPGIIGGVTGRDGLPYQSIKWALADERGYRLAPTQNWFDKLEELELL